MKQRRRKDRSKDVTRVHNELLRRMREKVANLHDIEDFIEPMRASIPQINFLEELDTGKESRHKKRAPCLEIDRNLEYRSVRISTWNVPYDQVVEHLAGPVHRMFNTLWHLEVREDGTLVLDGKLIDKPYWEKGIDIEFVINDGIEKCRIVETHSHTYTHSYTQKTFKIECS